jgi:hypothetical protein
LRGVSRAGVAKCKAPFKTETVRKIVELKGVCEPNLDALASHRLKVT